MEKYYMEFAILGKVLLSILFGGIIGYEREKAHKPAGFRTQMIVSGAACLLVLLADVIIHKYASDPFTPVIRTDPLRIIEAIIVGVSFIGAGTILKTTSAKSETGTTEAVKNLTTAATILFSSGIGISVALEKFVLAAGLTLVILAINYVMKKIE